MKPTKRGRRASTSLIARELGISISTVERDIKSAVRKLKSQGKYSALLACVHAVSTDEKDISQPSSMECLIARGDYTP